VLNSILAILNTTVILGDTYNPYEISHLAEDTNILVHEATLPEMYKKHASERGHSTVSMAAKFAAHIRAKKLVLSHFGKMVEVQVCDSYCQL
jgi:ribonuclease Z